MAFYSVVYLAILLANIHFIRQTKKKVCIALAALSILVRLSIPTLVGDSLSHCHFRICTQRVAFLRLGTLQTIVQSDVWIKKKQIKLTNSGAFKSVSLCDLDTPCWQAALR